MADKKLSDFSYVQQSDVSDLIVLFLDENNAHKNGRLNFQTFVSGLALLGSSNTFVGANTFSGNVVFSGNATFNNTINANISGNSATATTATTATSATNATNATNDGSGNEISETYMKKDLSNATTTAKATVAGLASPDYSAIISVASGVSSVSYTAPSSGVLIATGAGGTTDWINSIKVNGYSIPSFNRAVSGEYNVSVTIPLSKNDVLTMSAANGHVNINSVIFVPNFGG